MPNLHVVSPDWHRTDLETVPPVQIPDITDVVQQTLARLLGWDANGGQFRRIAVDATGRILVSDSYAITSNLHEISGSATITPSVAIAANSARQYTLIRNRGLNIIYVGYSSSVSVTQGIPIDTEEIFIDDSWRGDVWVVAAGGSQAFYGLEY